MDEFSELEIQKCVGWLYVGTLPHYVMANVPDAEIKAMRRAKEAVRKLCNAKELRPLMAAFEITSGVCPEK